MGKGEARGAIQKELSGEASTLDGGNATLCPATYSIKRIDRANNGK